MPSQPGQSGFSLWWVVPAVAVPVLVLLGLIVGFSRDPIQSGSSYDPSDRGLLAAYLLLEELGYPVTRSREATGSNVRFVLNPSPAPRQARDLDAWIRNGGRLILADGDGAFSSTIGIEISAIGSGFDGVEETSGALTGRVKAGSLYVDWHGEDGRVWAKAGGLPFVTIYPRGRGEIWLIHRPQFLDNRLLREADNGLVLCRLAEASLDGKYGPIAFDEFFHGYRDRPGVVQLLLTSPAVWVTVHGLALLGVLMWRHVPRFGPLRPAESTSRRSREEFLEALAMLLARRGDRAEAYGVAQDALIRELERELGLPPGSPEIVAAEAARVRNISAERLRKALDPDRPAAVARPQAFVEALRELEAIRDEFFANRSRR